MRTVKGIGRAVHGLLEAAASSPVRKSPTNSGMRARQSGFFPSMLGKQQLRSWELNPSLGARLGVGLHSSGTVTPALGCHPQPSSHTSLWKTRCVHCCSDRSSPIALRERGFILKETLFLTMALAQLGPAQPTWLSCRVGFPCSCTEKLLISDCDGDLKCCLQGSKE